MAISVQICPLCRGSRSRLFDQRTFRDRLASNRVCKTCGLVFQSPRMTDEELDRFYADEYRQLYQGSQGPNPKDLAIQASRAETLVRFIKEAAQAGRLPNPASPMRHLDIGCSAGLLLQRFQLAFNLTPTGIEPGTVYRGYAQAQGIEVYQSLDELASQPKQFDWISLAHVLEHIAEPVDYLVNLRQNWLKPDGWLLIEVPNLYGHDCFEVAHLVSYSPQTLKQTLKQAGFQVVVEKIHGQPRSKILPLYITLLARPEANSAPAAVEPETGVRFKRRAAMLRRSLLSRLAPRQAWLPVPPAN